MITDEQIEQLRARLTGDYAHLPRIADLDKDNRVAHMILLSAAFVEAVDRRFSGKVDRSAIIQFVGDLRSRSQEFADSLDPEQTERLIRHSLGDNVSIDDVSGSDEVTTYIIVTAALVSDEKMDEAQFEEFITEVRSLADDQLG